jgi:hypothetical protein
LVWLVASGFALEDRAEAAEPAGDADRWVPSFSFYFDITNQKATGSVSTGVLMGPPLPPYGTGCGGFPLCDSNRTEDFLVDHADAGADTSVAPGVGASLELMTPRLFDGFLDPRVFAHGDVSLAFGFERNLAGQGRPGPFAVPPHAQVQDDLEELSIPGQGSRARWQLDGTVYSAGGGIALTFKLLERTFRIKPSFEWTQVEQDFIGVTRRAVKLRSPAYPRASYPSGIPPEGAPLDPSAFREISLTHVETKSFDAIGPGLELEADTARLGPILSSLYVSGRAYHFMKSLDTTLTATNEFGETATWTFEPERWMYRVGIGFRLRWAPEAE